MNLPGAIHQAFIEDRCEQHPSLQAVAVVQGETDSFGAEMHPMCQQCLDNYNAQPKFVAGKCDWCKTDSLDLRPTRDYDEGSNGPVYYVCRSCRLKQQEQAERELAELRAEEIDHEYDLESYDGGEEYESEN